MLDYALLDAMAAVLAYRQLRQGGPADRRHPFGHFAADQAAGGASRHQPDPAGAALHRHAGGPAALPPCGGDRVDGAQPALRTRRADPERTSAEPSASLSTPTALRPGSCPRLPGSRGGCSILSSTTRATRPNGSGAAKSVPQSAQMPGRCRPRQPFARARPISPRPARLHAPLVCQRRRRGTLARRQHHLQHQG